MSTVFWWYTTANLSPLVSREFLERQRRILLPGQYCREHENAWVDAADSFTTAAEVDDAMDGSWVESVAGEPGREYVLAVDIGLITDPTVVSAGHAEDDLVCIDRIVTLQGSRETPVQLAAVESTIIDLAQRFPASRILVESWQGAGLVQSLARRGWPVEQFMPTAKALGDQWAVLAQFLASRRVVLPVHATLRDELLNLTVEVGPTGARVLDRGKIHQDVATTVRMIVAALATPAPLPAEMFFLG